MEVVDVVIDEALSDKEIKRLLVKAKSKSYDNEDYENENDDGDYNNNNDIVDDYDEDNNNTILSLPTLSSPSSSSPKNVVLPQFSNSEPHRHNHQHHIMDKKKKQNKSDRYNNSNDINNFNKTHTIDKDGKFSLYSNTNDDIDELDKIISNNNNNNSINNLSTASTNDWSRPVINTFKHKHNESIEEYNSNNNSYDDIYSFDDNINTNDESLTERNRRVKFDNNLVTDIFTRDKCTREETLTLFYTHEEACKFTADYNRECYRAQSEGISWYDWWQGRDTGIDDDDDDDDLEISDDFIVEPDEN